VGIARPRRRTIVADEIELFKPVRAVAVTRYRCRGARIPAPRAIATTRLLIGVGSWKGRMRGLTRTSGEASYDRDNPLDVGLLVVDEASTLDLVLANEFVKAVPLDAHLLLVGDVDQLPSAGAGEVLRVLLAADTIPGYGCNATCSTPPSLTPRSPCPGRLPPRSGRRHTALTFQLDR
jgi:hypothetical protein